jgi:plastocyanin
MLCCPVMKSAIVLGGLALLGYSGYEASHLYSDYLNLSKPGCCQPKAPVLTPASGEETSPVLVSANKCAGACCSIPSRADSVVSATPAASDCCEDDAPTGTPITTKAPAVVEGWATVKGQIVFGGDTIPKPAESKVTSDQDTCLAKGPAFDVVWNVNPSNKGLAGVVVFIQPERDEKLPVHPDQQATPAPFVLDQPNCVFTPRVFAIRAGQVITAKNPDPCAHNVVVKGLKNDLNVQVPPKTDKQLKLTSETNAMAISCGSHPWMRGYGWCFDHPYFAVTDKDGKFEIKNVPAGSRKIVIWHETGFLSGYAKRDGKVLSLAAGATVDMGTVKAMLK